MILKICRKVLNVEDPEHIVEYHQTPSVQYHGGKIAYVDPVSGMMTTREVSMCRYIQISDGGAILFEKGTAAHANTGGAHDS